MPGAAVHANLTETISPDVGKFGLFRTICHYDDGAVPVQSLPLPPTRSNAKDKDMVAFFICSRTPGQLSMPGGDVSNERAPCSIPAVSSGLETSRPVAACFFFCWRLARHMQCFGLLAWCGGAIVFHVRLQGFVVNNMTLQSLGSVDKRLGRLYFAGRGGATRG